MYAKQPRHHRKIEELWLYNLWKKSKFSFIQSGEVATVIRIANSTRCIMETK